MILSKIKRLFSSGDWVIAIKEKKQLKFNIVDNKADVWFADPFVVEKNKDIFIFCEGFEKKKNKGCIYCIDLKKRQYTKIIENNYHMSYPNIFKINQTYYMIPETSENKTIELYECIDFPYGWKKNKDILSNINCVDTNVLFIEDSFFLHTQEYLDGIKYISIYKSNINFDYIECVCRKKIKKDDKRNGGAFYYFGKKLYRPSQISYKIYGEKLLIREVNTKNLLEEKEMKTISIKNIEVDSRKKFSRVHTYNQSENFEVVDLHTKQMSFTSGIKKIYYKIFRRTK